MPTTNINQPLAGVRVIEFGQFIAGPGATQILADLGADVIKIESPNGDNARRFGASDATKGRSGMFMAYNRGKRSVMLDMRKPAGLAAAVKLALDADVVVQNTRVGVMDRLGLGSDALREKKPSLIHASISGFGTSGPSKSRPGLDIAAQAESGIMSITGEYGGTPLKVGFAVVDAATANATASAILAALFRHARTGEGATIEVSLLNVAIGLQAQIWAEYQCTKKIPMRFGNSQPLVAPAAELVEVQDGYIVVSAYMDDHWRRLCQAIKKPELTADPRFTNNSARVQNRADLVSYIQKALGAYTAEEARTFLESHGIVVGVVRNYEQVLANADVQASGTFQSVHDDLDSEIMVPTLPFSLNDTSSASTQRVPALGQHTVEVLTEAGFTNDEIAHL